MAELPSCYGRHHDASSSICGICSVQIKCAAKSRFAQQADLDKPFFPESAANYGGFQPGTAIGCAHAAVYKTSTVKRVFGTRDIYPAYLSFCRVNRVPIGSWERVVRKVLVRMTAAGILTHVNRLSWRFT